VSESIGRNDPCPCGSGKKYKQCCLAKDEAKAREARLAAQEQAAQAEPAAEAEEANAAAANRSGSPQASRPATRQPWKRGNASTNTRGFGKVSATRKVGSG